MVHCVYLRVIGYYFKKYYIISFPEDRFVLAKSVDPDKMPHSVVFNLDPFKVFQSTKSILTESSIQYNSSLQSHLNGCFARLAKC